MPNFVKLPLDGHNVEVAVVQPANRPFLIITNRTEFDIPFVRIHSSCVFGEALGALDCDCGEQLRAALTLLESEGGYIVYGWDEGRGVGIKNKVDAIFLQQSNGLNTADAFQAMNFPSEPRDFKEYVDALKLVCESKQIRFGSNNPKKIQAIENGGYSVVDRVVLEVQKTPERVEYLKNKKIALGHLIDEE